MDWMAIIGWITLGILVVVLTVVYIRDIYKGGYQ